MRLIDADELNFEKLQDTNGKAIPANEYIAFLKGAIAAEELVKNAPTIDVEPLSEDFARFVTKSIACLLSELRIDLPSMIYEDIEHTLMKGNFVKVETFVRNYIQNNCKKMDKEVDNDQQKSD